MRVELGRFLDQKSFKGATVEPCHCSLHIFWDLKGELLESKDRNPENLNSFQSKCLPCRAGQAEHRVHKAAQKRGLNMDVELSYFELPLCTDTDEGKMELVPWPFLLPSVLVSLQQQANKHCFNGGYRLFLRI